MAEKKFEPLDNIPPEKREIGKATVEQKWNASDARYEIYRRMRIEAGQAKNMRGQIKPARPEGRECACGLRRSSFGSIVEFNDHREICDGGAET